MNIKIIATSALAILAVVALISVLGYIQGQDLQLLSFAKSVVGYVVLGIIIVTALINSPRILRSLR